MKSSNDKRYAALMSKVGMQVKGVGHMGAVDIGLICTLKRVSLLVKELIDSEGDAFNISVVAEFRSACLESNAPGKILLKLLKARIPTGSQFASLYTFEPYIEMVVSRLVEFGLDRLQLPRRTEIPIDDARKLMIHLNKCVEKIRQDSKSRQFKSRLNSYHRSSNKNHKELTEYVDALFERYSRLLVLRIDLSYSKENCNTTQAEAARDRERLFENARSNRLFAHMVGWVWKLEHGPEKGFHYHMMFFFDGSKVREDITKANLIGLYWIDVVTKGRGLYYNCNAVKFAYKSCGIGMIDHADVQLREGLRNAVVYLAKTDLYMKLQTEGRGMGKMNRPRPKDLRGRPRAVISPI